MVRTKKSAIEKLQTTAALATAKAEAAPVSAKTDYDVYDEDDEQEKKKENTETQTQTQTTMKKKKKLTRKGKKDDDDDEKSAKKRKVSEAEEEVEDERANKLTTKRAKANKEKANERSFEMTKKQEENKKKERKKGDDVVDDDDVVDVGGGGDDDDNNAPVQKEKKPKASSKVTVNKAPKAAAQQRAKRATNSIANATNDLVLEIPVVKVASSVPQLMDLKKIMENEMIEHEEANANMRMAEQERTAALQALDEANRKAEQVSSHLNRVSRRMKQTARKVAAQTVNAQMLEQTMITKTVKNWAKSKDEGMKEAREICLSIMNEWIEMIKSTAHLMTAVPATATIKAEDAPTKETIDVNTSGVKLESGGEIIKEEKEVIIASETIIDKQTEQKPSEIIHANDIKKENEQEQQKQKQKQQEEKKSIVESLLPGPLADIYKIDETKATKLLLESKSLATQHGIPKEPTHSAMRMKVIEYIHNTFNLSRNAARTCEAAVFNFKAEPSVQYKAAIKKLADEGAHALKSGSAQLDIGKVPPGLTLLMNKK